MAAGQRLKILWCNRYCLADTSSGASMSIREMLLQMSKAGCEVVILGATVSDSEIGLDHVRDQIRKAQEKTFSMEDGPLTYTLVKTQSYKSAEMKLSELNTLHALYRKSLVSFEPDVVFFYGGNSFDLLIPSEAKRFGVPSVAYLANGNYKSTRWCEDVDLILTNSDASKKMYKEKLDIDCEISGTFVPPERFVSTHHSYSHVTFVNPRLAKGAGIVAQVAIAMEESRPDILFEVVESRGQWADVLKATSRTIGAPREKLDNVMVTPHTKDMRPIYGRSRLVLMPSLWWESAGRVVVEAMLNGIPAIVSGNGGPAEMIGNAGVKMIFPEELHKSPYKKLLPPQAVQTLCDTISKFFDDESYYRTLTHQAHAVARSKHNIQRNTERLIARFHKLAQTSALPRTL